MPDPRAVSVTPGGHAPPADTLEERLRAALAPSLLLVREIGAGGMARVFLAREPALKRLVAIKVLSGDVAASTEGRARFEREAQAVAGLSHPNIVAIHSVGELDDGTPYFVMQYVEGQSMSARVEQEGPVSIAEGRRVIAEVAAALAAAHKQGIIHRDIKPANILYEESTGRALVSDFGIAAIHTGEGAAPPQMRLTATGIMIGTPQYMSPEQLLAEPVSEKTDVYSLGVLAHELLAGKAPFTASTPHELIAMHLRDIPKRLSEVRPGVDAEFDEVIARCLEKDASKRPAAEEVAKRLSPGGGGLLEWPPPGLDDVRGGLSGVSTLSWWGAGLVVGTCIVLLSGVRVASGPAGQLTVLLLPALVVGILLLGWALWRMIVLGAHVTRAVHGGYAWLTVLEVIADRRGDTGNLITGSREYSALRPDQRAHFRAWRIVRETLLLSGAMLALPMLLLATVLGSGGAGPGVLWLAAAIPLLLGTVALWLADRERFAFKSWRKRKSTVTEGDALRLASGWNDSFETARAGQSLGRGASTKSRAGRAGAIAVAAGIAAVLLLMLPYIFVGMVGPRYAGLAYPTFGLFQSRREAARVLRPYGVPRASSITPIQAGRALVMLLPPGNKSQPSRFAELPLPAPVFPEPPWRDKMPPGLFPDARPDFVDGLPSSTKIMAAVARGLTREELAYLEPIAHAPHWRAFETLARARDYDYLGAKLRLPFPAHEGTWMELPIPRYATLRELAYASAARAAFHLAQGRRDSAETALREAISTGLLLADHGNFLIESLIGTVVARIGGETLLSYYQTVRDPRAPTLKAKRDSAAAVIEARSETGVSQLQSESRRDPAVLRATLLRNATDTSALRTIRYEAGFVHLGMAPCLNVRELVFGLGAPARQAFADARKTWTRFASDSALLDLVETSSQRIMQERRGPVRLYARVVGAMTGNPRVAGCTVLATVLLANN